MKTPTELLDGLVAEMTARSNKERRLDIQNPIIIVVEDELASLYRARPAPVA